MEQYGFYKMDFREISYLVFCICDKQEKLAICTSYVNRGDMTRYGLTLVPASAAA